MQFEFLSIPRSRPNIDRLRFGLAILNRFSRILVYCDSTQFCALAAEILAIPGQRFWDRDSRFYAAKVESFDSFSALFGLSGLIFRVWA